MEFIAAFLSDQVNLYMIHHNLDLFYDIYNPINENNERQTHDLHRLFQIILISILR